MTAGRCYMGSAGVVPDGERRRARKIHKGGELRAADEVDRGGTGGTDVDRQFLLARGPDDDREISGCLEEPLRQLAVGPRGPTLYRVTRRGSRNQQKKRAVLQLGRQGPG